MPDKQRKTSLAVKLNATLFFRQLWSAFWLDVMICAMFCAGLLYHTEISAYPFLQDYLSPARPSSNSSSLIAPTGSVSLGGAGRASAAGGSAAQTRTLHVDATRRIMWMDYQPHTLFLPENLTNIMPEPLRSMEAGRWLFHGDKSLGWRQQTESLVYLLAVRDGNGWLVIETQLGLPVTIFAYCFFVILILQALSLFGSLRQNSHSIHKTLQPLQELTVTTQALTAKGGRLSPEALKRLTGALDSINVSHLDSRLPLSGINNELKPLAAAINEMLARIDDAYREQIRFVSDASHELRTPIAVIQGYADLLSRWGTEDPETMMESITAIRHEAEAMKQMVEQLLFLARGESDFMSLEWKPVDVSALGAEVFREIEMINGTHRFVSAFAPSVFVEGDDGMLKQLMRSLVDNSIKYTPPGGQITIKVENRGTHAAVLVQDEGAGIPEEAIPFIFDRFYRADESRNRGTGGAGLGLSIAKWIAQRHRGSIEVMSRENIGTRMTVLLPLYTA